MYSYNTVYIIYLYNFTEFIKQVHIKRLQIERLSFSASGRAVDFNPAANWPGSHMFLSGCCTNQHPAPLPDDKREKNTNSDIIKKKTPHPEGFLCQTVKRISAQNHFCSTSMGNIRRSRKLFWERTTAE